MAKLSKFTYLIKILARIAHFMDEKGYRSVGEMRGIAVVRAAEEAKGILLEEAAELLEANLQDLMIQEGQIFVEGVSKPLATVAEVAHYALFRKNGRRIRGSGQDEPNTTKMDLTKQTNPCSTYSFAAQPIWPIGKIKYFIV